MKRYLDRRLSHAATILEIIFSVLFIEEGLKVGFTRPVPREGLLNYTSNHLALYIYALVWTGAGVGLLWAKFTQNKKLHSHSLLVMFASCVYVIILSFAINDFDPKQIVPAIVAPIVAWLWLRWKFITEYIDPKQFNHVTLDKH